MNYKETILVPAKAMLFGEYGVLAYGNAIAVTFYDHQFLIELIIESNKKNLDSCFTIESSFFKNNKIHFSYKDIIENNSNSENSFFINLLKPWTDELKNFCLHLKVVNFYSPSLGFGSSSAIIAGFNKGLWSYFYPSINALKNEFFWKKIRQTVELIQGVGSAYDIAVQYASCENKKNSIQLWRFKNSPNSVVPLIEEYNPTELISAYGCFIKTHIYSDTKESLKIFLDSQKKEIIAKQHTKICEDFIKNSSIKNTIKCIKNAFDLALEQGILPLHNNELKKRVDALLKYNIPFKTMGAGYGDCLWTLASSEQLLTQQIVTESEISFAFEKYGDLPCNIKR